MTPQSKRQRSSTTKVDETVADFPLEGSVGYQVRATHRLLQRFLQVRIAPHGVTLGMWYFLRALWAEDGLTQRELSRRIGTMEPTTLSAINNMERSGLVRRVRNAADKRKWHVCLTPKGKRLKLELIPLARDVVDRAVDGLRAEEIANLLTLLTKVQGNIGAAIDEAEVDAGSDQQDGAA